MLGAVAKLDPDDVDRDEPEELSQAVVHSLQLSLDHDNNSGTSPQLFDNFLDLLQATNSTNRADIRFGEGAFGEMYISSKQNGTVYLVTNSVAVPGDFNADGTVNGLDYLVWQQDQGSIGAKSPADANRDELVDDLDLTIWRDHYGEQYGTSPLLAVGIPEPSSAVLAIFGLVLAFRSSSRNCAVH